MAENKRDYYEELGIDRGADESAIKSAYRRLAKQYHPDMNPGNAEAEARFKAVNEAYAVLSDPEKKARYDQYGFAGVDPNMGGGGGYGGFDGFDISDIFSSFFGGGGGGSRRNGPIRGDDLQYRLTLTFEEAAFGCKKTITYPRVQRCGDCGGSGAASGTAPEVCSVCRGSGQVRTQQRTPLGMFQTTHACDACGGTGKVIKNPCKNCSGKGYVRINKTLDVTIPAGIDNGERIGLQGLGNDGRGGGAPGDLVIVLSVRAHKTFERDGYNLYCEIPISFPQAALGAEITVPTLEGDITYTIPEGTQTGTSFTVKGKGIQYVRGNRKGDLIFTVRITVPKGLSGAQKDLLRAYDEAVTGVSSPKVSFFGKKKDKDK